MLFAVLFYTMDMQQLQMTGYERTFIFSFLTWHWLKFSFNTQTMELTFQALKYHEFEFLYLHVLELIACLNSNSRVILVLQYLWVLSSTGTWKSKVGENLSSLFDVYVYNNNQWGSRILEVTIGGK
jgi:hypothetical protein